MATIKVKRGTTDPTAAQVTNAGELAANTSTPKIWLKTADDSSTTPVWVGAQIEASPGDWSSTVKLPTQSAVNTTFMPKAGGTFSGDISLSGGSDIRFVETGGGTDFIAFQAPAAIAASVTFTLPSADGSNGHVLTTNGSGTLSWGAASASSLAVTADNSASTFYPTFVTGSGSGLTLYADPTTTALSYVPSTSTLTASTFVGTHKGNVQSSATDGALTLTGTGSDTSASITVTGAAVAGSESVTVAGGTINLNCSAGGGASGLVVANGNITHSGSNFELPTTYTIQDSATGVNSTLTIAGQATASTFGKTVNIGTSTAAGGTSTINIATGMNATGIAAVTIGSTTGSSSTTLNGTVTVASDIAVNGGDVTTTATGTATVFNTNATTLNMGGAATTVSIGAGSGTTTINNDLAVTGADITTSSTGTATLFNTNATTVNIAGAGTTVSIGAGTGTTTINNANTAVTGDLAVNGGDITTSSTTATVFNTTATTLNMGGSATTISIGSGVSGTTTVNHNLSASGDMSIASGKVYKINGTQVLSATALGSGVTGSSLTSVGTIGTGVWQGTAVAVGYGGTGTATGSITGTGALSFTAGGTNTNVNLVPNGSGTVDVASKRITNVFTPSASTDAANKQYVDDVAQGLHIHSTAAAATTAKLATLAGVAVTYSSGTQAITWTGGTAVTSVFTDGQALTANTTEASASRILVKNEGDSGGLGSQYNGIYYCYGARELRRATDGNVAADWAGGDFAFVLAGTLYNNTGWVQTEKVTTLDTDAILWEQFSGAGTYTADETTLTRSGSQFSIKSTYTGQTSITTLGTIASGTWNANVIGLTYGGTGKALTASNGGIVWTDADSMEVLAAGTSGYVLTSGGAGTPSWTNATDANTASAIVKRDASGNFTAGTITASLTGTASNASAVTMASETSDTTCFLAFVNAASASSQSLKYNSSLAYNSSTNYLDVNIDGGTY